jgi:hypothetical protein
MPTSFGEQEVSSNKGTVAILFRLLFAYHIRPITCCQTSWRAAGFELCIRARGPKPVRGLEMASATKLWAKIKESAT